MFVVGEQLNIEDSDELLWSADLPEPLLCVIDEDEGCTNPRQEHCSCKWDCGESSEAGCCYCAHSDPYEPCPRFGFACFPDCGDPTDCCTDEQRAFRAAAYSATKIAREAGWHETTATGTGEAK